VSFTFRCALIFVDTYAHTLYLKSNFNFQKRKFWIQDRKDRKARDRHSRWLTNSLPNDFCLLTYHTCLL